MMIGQARALFLDEISTGLDAAATFDIVSALKKWTRVMNGSAMVALLQPAPEVFDMFDQFVLMREGHIIFSGTQPELRAYLAANKIPPNEDQDFSDWLIEFLTDPPATWKRDVEARGRTSSMRSFRESFRDSHSSTPRPKEDIYSSGSNVLLVPGQVVSATPMQTPPRAASPKHASVAQAEEPHVVLFHMGSEDDPADPVVAVSKPSTGSSNGARGVHFPLNGTSPETSPPCVEGGVAPSQATGAVAPLRRKGLGQLVSSKDIPLTTTALRQRYQSSSLYKDLKVELGVRKDELTRSHSEVSKGPSAFTHAQYYTKNSRGVWQHTLANLRRQFLVVSRSTQTLIGPRIGQSM
jgi:hypothetical protein